jgi:excinuclease ABC subunit A
MDNRDTNSSRIVIQGASEHNLKNINLEIPRRRLIVITGVSGSGKSSLAFDTLYAEGQRRYVESLSSYARQFLGQMEKPHVDFIGGLSPAIAIEQKSASHNPRSTVGTVTEIYDYLRVMFARAGRQYCPGCDQPITSQSSQQMVESILSLPDATRILITSPMVQNRKGEHREVLELARREGFVRIRIDGQVHDVDESITLNKRKKHTIDIIVDRLVVKEGIRSRLADSVEIALKLAEGLLKVIVVDGDELLFSEHAACLKCGGSFPPLSPQSFSFNSPLGMCQRCSGLGSILHPDPDLVIRDPNASMGKGAVKFLGTLDDNPRSWTARRINAIVQFLGFSLDTPWKKVPEKAQNVILYGLPRNDPLRKQKPPRVVRYWNGVLTDIQRLYLQTKSEGMRRWYSQFIRNVPCPDCHGTRLSLSARAVKFGGVSISDVTQMSVMNCLTWLDQLDLTAIEQRIAEEVIREVRNRLNFLKDVGLHYLTLDRQAPSLSGGEAQRIRLASQIGSGLVGVLYILDEPSIGLHARDTSRLMDTLKALRDMGNTVIVVEHDPDTIRSADYIVDMGPGAGHQGGHVVASGTPDEIGKNNSSLTGGYLNGRLSIPVPQTRRRKRNGSICVLGAMENNLKDVNVTFPLSRFICVTGVSGSGKSTLVNQILYRALAEKLHGSTRRSGRHRDITGFQKIDRLIEITQKPIGRTPRSNPATYTNVFTHIRALFAQLPEAKLRGYAPGRFSFNVKGGRCEACRGDGLKRIEMHFLPDVYVTCEVCKGKRFNRETLEVKYRGLTIDDILNLEVRQAVDIFSKVPKITKICQTVQDVGLGYIKLGQPATTLSGGEAQRVKLARELAKNETGKTLYILDEPTTGLHSHDIGKLLSVLHKLVNMGNTVIIIEHNMDVIKNSDWIIDLGPEGGDGGGFVIATGRPEKVAMNPDSFTGQHLKKHLSATV